MKIIKKNLIMMELAITKRTLDTDIKIYDDIQKSIDEAINLIKLKKSRSRLMSTDIVDDVDNEKIKTKVPSPSSIAHHSSETAGCAIEIYVEMPGGREIRLIVWDSVTGFNKEGYEELKKKYEKEEKRLLLTKTNKLLTTDYE